MHGFLPGVRGESGVPETGFMLISSVRNFFSPGYSMETRVFHVQYDTSLEGMN